MILTFSKKRSGFHISSESVDRRLILIMATIFLVSVFVILRLFQLQVLQHSFYSALASGQHEIYQKLFPERGKIYTQDTRAGREELFPAATNKDFYLVYAEPKNVINPDQTAEQLIEVLYNDDEFLSGPNAYNKSVDSITDEKKLAEARRVVALANIKEELVAKLSKADDPYEPIKSMVSEELKKKVEELESPGIRFAKESWRYYPEKNIGSHVIGFLSLTGEKKVGHYGIEGYFNKELSGSQGSLRSERDAAGRWIALTEKEFTPAVDGDDIVLTIDHNIEYFACAKLNEYALRHGADSGSVVIMDPATGAILAMCSYPDFDPNKYSEVKNIDYFNNQAIFGQYEPGSIFKSITMAAAIDQEKVVPSTTYVDEGFVKIGEYTIKNAADKVYGQSDMIGVLNNSINTGAIFVARQIGPKLFQKYVEDFGFGALSGIELETESTSNISSLNKDSEIYMATASFGQGITATPLQMTVAYGAIANQGKLMSPYIVKKVVRKSGEVIETKPQVLRQVISPRAATLVSGMLVSVVREGHPKRAGVKGYYIAGKTGTAQVAEKGTGKYGSRTIHSFVGFAPVDNPRFVATVRLDDPKSVPFADSSVAPLFGEIADFVLKYYQIPPDEKSE
ncbi:MAG: penicillin-binding protein 2 [Patescibacteria group bacterium]|nr:penicillin-binding protein 2 [Patescibacteria group bacterium]MDD5490588.1 penicillin-binding protein 2 [Patescibacteria group bacterium]